MTEYSISKQTVSTHFYEEKMKSIATTVINEQYLSFGRTQHKVNTSLQSEKTGNADKLLLIPSS
jgi:hypothetical protein